MSIFGKKLRRSSLRLLGVPSTVAIALAGVVAMSVSVPKMASDIASAGETPLSHIAGDESNVLPRAEVLSDMFRSAAQQVLPSVVEIKVALTESGPTNTNSRQRYE